MAEAIVSLAVQRITDLLIQEANFLSGVRGEVVRLQEELKRMQCFLKDADRMQDQDERVRNLVAQIRTAAYDAEDVIDTFILKAATGRGKRARGFLKYFTSIFTKGLDFHEIRNQIEALRTKIADISASMQIYGIQSSFAEKEGSSSARAKQRRWRTSYPHEEEEHVVSFEPIAENLKAQLMIEEERLRVISVVGMGGLGKTTLAKKVYNDIDVKQHFDCCTWAFVSQQFSIRDILIRVLTDVASSEDKLKLENRKERMVEKEALERIKEQSFNSMLEWIEGIKKQEPFKSILESMKEKKEEPSKSTSETTKEKEQPSKSTSETMEEKKENPSKSTSETTKEKEQPYKSTSETLEEKFFEMIKEVEQFKSMLEKIGEKLLFERIKKEPLFKSMLEKLFERMKEKQSFKSMLERMEEEDLVKTLFEVLGEKRYLVVLDDIWSQEAWDCLKHAFPKGKRGSKVLFTTRNREVASHADPWSSPVELPLLTIEESWELLCRKAFPKEIIIEHSYPPEFEKLGREMVKKCGGLPLAVVVLGGLLATKKSLKEWEVVQKNINAQFTKLQQNQYGGVYGILGMSYQDLPFHLKPCFLHLAQFPEDWEFHKRSLIRLWIAEGFVLQAVQEGGEEIVEDVCEQYLDELVSRCMVQVSERDYTGIGVKIFRMHDLMRDMCISKARDESFATFIEHRDRLASNNSSSCFVRLATSNARRIAVSPHISGDDSGKLFYVPLVKCGDLATIRSLVYFVERDKYKMGRDQEIYIFENYRLLRVLDLKGIRISGYIHGAIGNLIHLRYLGLRETGLWRREQLFDLKSASSLPASIGELKHLDTLDLRDNLMELRRDVLRKLENLRNLFLEEYYVGESIGLDSLWQLETLKMVEAKSLITRKKAVVVLPNLRNLGIIFGSMIEADFVIKSHSIFGEGNHLCSLKMSIIDRFRIYQDSFPNLESLSNCHNLKKLELLGCIAEEDHNLQFLPKSLVKLILEKSSLKQDPMGILGKELPNLRFLSLKDEAYKGYKMVCSAYGFPKLEFLMLVDLYEWEIEEGAMPCLNTLSLRLEMIPEGLKFFTTLRELKLTGVTKELRRRVQVENGVEGEDFHKIRHIPFLTIS